MRHWIGNSGKRRSCWLLAAAVVCACSIALAAGLSFPFNTITNDKVNLRARASTNSGLLQHLPQGQALTVLGERGGFFRVQVGSKTGYVVKKYVVTEGDAVTTPTADPSMIATGYPYETTTTASATFYAKNDRTSKKLGTIRKGATVFVQSTTNSYAKVTYNGQDGYIRKTTVRLKTVLETPKPTAAPVTLPPAKNDASYTTLQLGSTGDQVRALQSALLELGFLNGSIDGTFGTSTQYAVTALQSRNGYPMTGVADANLQAMIYSGRPKNSNGVKTDVKTIAPIDGVIIRLNDKGDRIARIQDKLRALGFYTGDSTGLYDKTTRAAIIAFQKKNKIKADGVIGTNTQELLFGNGLSLDATATPKPTAEPTPAPTFAKPSGKVTRSSSKADIALVQNRLKQLGYYGGRIDGKFGGGTIAALKAFQTKNGLKADGVAGTETNALLFSYNALSVTATATPPATPVPTLAPAQPTPAPTPLTEQNIVVIRQGAVGAVVSAIQRRLTALGYYQANVDGVFKADDVAAVRAFQKQNNLNADGVAGFKTQSVLFSGSARMPNGQVAGTTGTETLLRKGMTGEAVVQLQQRLIALGFLKGTADGNYGIKTAEAVYRFQRANKLPRDGVAGPATLRALYATAGTNPQGAPTAAPTAAPTTVRRGDRNNIVRDLQTRLIALGYLSGRADGKFGLQTYQAVLAFQRANGLVTDGIVGSATMNRLNTAGGKNNAAPTPDPKKAPNASQNYTPRAANVRYANWYTEVKAKARQYPYVTLYDFQTGISWQIHFFSLGAHADGEPLTAADTAKMQSAVGMNTWNPRPVWVIFGDGSTYLASTHSNPHGVQHNRDNNFSGHTCIHFPRTESQVAAIGPYATSHQKTIDKAWRVTQGMIK